MLQNVNNLIRQIRHHIVCLTIFVEDLLFLVTFSIFVCTFPVINDLYAL